MHLFPALPPAVSNSGVVLSFDPTFHIKDHMRSKVFWLSSTFNHAVHDLTYLINVETARHTRSSYL